MTSTIFRKHKGAAYIIRWPPWKGEPEGEWIIAKLRFYIWKGQPCPDWFYELVPPGYQVSWHPARNKPVVTWSKEAKARVRKQRLKKRLEKYPLFEDVLYDQEIENDPAYFEAETQERS